MKRKNKELEKRVVEEQLKLLKKQKTAKVKVKKQKKPEQKDISDKVKIKKPKQEIHKSIDYSRFLEQQQKKLDYASMFSYLGGSVKTLQYEYQESPEAISAIHRKYETLSWEEIKNFTEEWKMDQVQNFNRSFETSDQRTAYKWWKALNPGIAHVLYELCLT